MIFQTSPKIAQIFASSAHSVTGENMPARVKKFFCPRYIIRLTLDTFCLI